MTLGSLTSELGQLGSLVTDSWGDTTPVEPGSPLHDSIEVEILGISFCDSAVSTVIDHL